MEERFRTRPLSHCVISCSGKPRLDQTWPASLQQSDLNDGAEAARMMRQADVGSLIVLEEGAVCGMVTDRDITIRVVAEERDIRSTPVGEICSREPLTLSVSDSIEQAIELMPSNSIRRVPVLDEKGRPVGIVSLGDLAIERGGASAISVRRPRIAERG